MADQGGVEILDVDDVAERLDDLLDLLPDAALLVDADGNVRGANAAALELFACPPGEAAHAALEALVPVREVLACASDGARLRIEGRRATGVPVRLDATVRWRTVRDERRALCCLREINFDRLASEAQLYFDAAFDQAPIGMGLFNCDGEYVRVNDALCELLGRTREELLGRRDQEFTHPDDRQADVDAAWQILAGRLHTHQCEKRFLRSDGSVRWALANLTFLRDEAGRALGWVGQFQEITARRAAEEALRSSEERHRLVVRNLPGGVALYDRELRCVLVEGRHMEAAGFVGNGFAGRSMKEIVPPESYEDVSAAARAALAGEASVLELVSSRDGGVGVAEVLPHRDADGGIAGVLFSVRDVTEQRAAESHLRDAEERFRLAFDHAPIGIALVSPDGRWLRVNDAVCAMTGFTKAELLSTTFQDITHPDDLGADLDALNRMLDGSLQTYEMEKRYIRADGSTIWILLSVSLVRSEGGSPEYFISHIQDIDERKRREGELAQLALRDPLTGVANRRTWDAALERALAESRGTRRPLAIALLDLNAFKAVNDTHGHHAGDALLVEAAAAWQAELRSGDLLARLGGDEFAVLLPDFEPRGLPSLGARLKRALAHAPGCAIGVAACTPGDDRDSLMKRADEALYVDKTSAAD